MLNLLYYTTFLVIPVPENTHLVDMDDATAWWWWWW